MDWFALAWASVVTTLTIWVPGLVLGWLAGLRGLLWFALAPAFSITTISVASIVAPMIGISWSLLPVVIAIAVLGAVVAALRFWLARRRTFAIAPEGSMWWTAAALVVAAVLVTWAVLQTIGVPSAFSQTFDNIFHLNAVRFILDTTNASSLHVGLLTSPPGGQMFYPAAWHAVVALIVQTTNVSIPIAINALTVVISALIWPAGIMLLTRVWFGGGAAVTVSAGVLAAAAPQFPLLLMQYGVLYPMQLGFALIPAAIATTSVFLGISAEKPATPRWWWAVLTLGALPGIAVAHPGAFVAWIALTAPLVLIWFITQLRAASARRTRVWLVVGMAGYLGIGVGLVRLLRPPADARGWPPIDSISHSIADVLTLGAYVAEPAIVLAALTLAGLIVAVRRGRPSDWAALGVWGLAGFLYVVVAALQLLPLRDILTGSWYNNIPRLAALLPIGAVPLAAAGGAAVVKWVVGIFGARGSAWRRASVAIVVALMVVTTQAGAIRASATTGNLTFALNDGSPLVDSDELALLERLDDVVPEGAVIAGSPWTGVSLAYALSGRHVLMPHTLMYETDDIREINAELRDAHPGSQVCDAMADLGVHYVLDFGAREVHGATHEFPGLERLSTSHAVELVDEEGHAKLYRITGCD